MAAEILNVNGAMSSDEIKYKETCDWLDEFWHDQNMFYCWGCGSGGAIEHHHMISRQEMRKLGKPEYLYWKKNIIPLCHHCHHNKWHNGGISNKMELYCFDFILDFYEEHHHKLFVLLTIKMDTHVKKH